MKVIQRDTLHKQSLKSWNSYNIRENVFQDMVYLKNIYFKLIKVKYQKGIIVNVYVPSHTALKYMNKSTFKRKTFKR